MEPDVLQIDHMEFGTETFAVGEARSNLFQRDDGTWEFVIRLVTKSAIVRSEKLRAVIDAKPSVEASALLSDAPSLEKGTQILQEQGYDYEREENLTVLYYFEHELIERLQITLLDVADEWIDAEVTGSAVVNGSNGRDPDATISVRTRFTRDSELRRSFC